MNDIQTTLLDLAETDLGIVKATRKEEAARRRIADADAALTAADAAVAAATERLGAVKADERETTRKIELYEQRRDTAIRALELGAGDPIAAEKQLQQCTAILDDLETRLLELMEARDEAETALAAARTAAEAAATGRADTTAASNAELAELATAKDRLASERAALFAQLDDDEIQTRYEQVRERRGTAVSSMAGEACRACNHVVPAQMLAEIKARKFLHMCRKCGRYLVVKE